MKLSDLTRDEQLALGGLLRILIRADGDFTEEEEERVGALGEELGGRDVLWKAISDSAQAFADDDAITRAGAAVSRPEARALILGVLTNVAGSDGVDASEQGIVDGLRAAWAMRG